MVTNDSRLRCVLMPLFPPHIPINACAAKAIAGHAEQHSSHVGANAHILVTRRLKIFKETRIRILLFWYARNDMGAQVNLVLGITCGCRSQQVRADYLLLGVL